MMRDDAEVGAVDQKREQRADAGRGQRRKNRDGMNIAFVQNAKHDVDGRQRGGDQERLACRANPDRLARFRRKRCGWWSGRPIRARPR